jgi:GMP synthase-like glutamine amidotransferase
LKPVVVIRHESEDSLAVGEDDLADAGLGPRYVDVWKGEPLPQLRDVSGLVFLGGSMGVEDSDQMPFLTAEQHLMTQCLQEQVPILAICLGAQLLAAAGGGLVSKAPRRSIGFLPVDTTDLAGSDPLLQAWCSNDRVLRWHEDTFDLPRSAELLMTATDIPNQAFRVGDCAWGVQFHLEVDREMLEAWIAASGEALQAVWDTDASDLRRQADAWLPHQESHARETVKAFADLVVRRSQERSTAAAAE